MYQYFTKYNFYVIIKLLWTAITAEKLHYKNLTAPLSKETYRYGWEGWQ